MRRISFFGQLYEQIRARWAAFLAAFFVIVFFSYAFLYIVDFVPEPIEEREESTSEILPQVRIGQTDQTLPADTVTSSGEVSTDRPISSAPPSVSQSPITTAPPVAASASAIPQTMILDSLGGRRVPVVNPTSRAIADLDEALLSGAVRHPDSADFSSDGNIFILGHSSHLPNVINRNFQVFNGLENMTWGDRIRLHSDTTEYIYRVERVYEALASEVIVPFTPGEARLTLATCNNFGSRDDRFIVEARLIGTQAL